MNVQQTIDQTRRAAASTPGQPMVARPGYAILTVKQTDFYRLPQLVKDTIQSCAKRSFQIGSYAQIEIPEWRKAEIMELAARLGVQ